MNPRSIQEYAEAMRARYLKATKKQKGRLLEEFCETTGYHRKAAIRLLRQAPAKPIERRGRKCVYERTLAVPLKQVWEAANCICSKRLVPFLPELVDSLQRHNELHLEPDQHRLLLAMSPSTMDRLLSESRRRRQALPYARQSSSAHPQPVCDSHQESSAHPHLRQLG